MADPVQKPDENIVIRTMKGDLEKLSGAKPEKEPSFAPPSGATEGKEKTESIPFTPISQEAQAPTYQAPAPPPPTRSEPAAPPLTAQPERALSAGRPPVLIIPPKTIPQKEFAEAPAKPLFKATPVWLKIAGIGLGVLLIALAGLYGYWKIFVQSQPPPPAPTPAATTTAPVLPIAPEATSTTPIKFFNKLPNKTVTIEISSKTPAALLNALKSEAAVEEARASVKQIKISYQGKPITAEEFFGLMSIFAPADFLSNYENEFALSFFIQKEGARPILILKTKNRTLAENQMKDWEAKTLATDIFPLFLSDGKLPKISTTFKSYLFIGQPVHYLNISLPFASLNYALYNDYLIFTTSSAGMFVILQDLTGQTVSFDYLKSLEASINQFTH